MPVESEVEREEIPGLDRREVDGIIGQSGAELHWDQG